ncbi:hypothetical protein CBS101457_001827 [Exobasidium rhododendri]|nr:hypothetical protein CBS101457_001827 [Exobasidium rhododendri]
MTSFPQSKTAVPIAFGAMTIGAAGKEQSRVHDAETVQSILDVLKKHGVVEIDSARAYGAGTSEELLATVGAEKQGFHIATKNFPSKRMQNAALGNKYDHSKEGVRECMQDSLNALQTEEIDLYYLHAPDREVDFAETLQAINEEYKQGHFKRFGISNYKASEVDEIMAIVEKNDYVAPTVYQGLYNAITRTAEEELLPCLRKHKISYYTYNPLGGGFFTGAYTAEMKEAGKSESLAKGSRFDEKTWQGQMYRKRYFHDAYFNALETIQKAAEKNKLTMAEIALRWNMHHSALKKEYNDHVIVSASSIKHIEDNLLDFEKGPLPDDVVAAVDEAWSQVKDSPNLPKYHF